MICRCVQSAFQVYWPNAFNFRSILLTLIWLCNTADCTIGMPRPVSWVSIWTPESLGARDVTPAISRSANQESGSVLYDEWTGAIERRENGRMGGGLGRVGEEILEKHDALWRHWVVNQMSVSKEQKINSDNGMKLNLHYIWLYGGAHMDSHGLIFQ